MKNLKEIRLSPNIAQHDLEIKAKQVDKFLAKKIQVRINLEVRGRLATKMESFFPIVEKFILLLSNASTTTSITNKGKTLSCVVNPKK
jgi:translation initiation factor IF-3